MIYCLNVLYLLRSEASFIRSLYGSVCFYNKRVLIKVAPKVNSDDITNPTNFATPKIHSISHIPSKTYFGYKSIVMLIVEIAHLSHT